MTRRVESAASCRTSRDRRQKRRVFQRRRSRPTEEKLKLDLPPGIRVRRIGPAKTLSQMLAAGEIDALHSPRMPSTLHAQPDKVRRLFERYVDVERAYYRKTKIFPIMHVIAIRREAYESNPWIAMSLYKAFMQSQSE